MENNKENIKSESPVFIKGNLTLTEEEGQVLINLINIALKSIGLEAADSASHLSKKINNAFIEPKKP